MARQFISYLRVSTTGQGRSGLGLEAQREAVARYLKPTDTLLDEVVEVETGKNNNRPALSDALRRCRVHGATLIVAKLDRLSRNAAFLMNLRDAGVPFEAVDLPSANSMTIGVMAVVAQHEREAISNRTKEALQAARARGVKLGGWRGGTRDYEALGVAGGAAVKAKATARASDLMPEIEAAKAAGATSMRAIAKHLSLAGVPTARGGSWTAVQVGRVLAHSSSSQT